MIMKNALIWIIPLALSLQLHAQKTGLKLQFTKVDSSISATGVSTASILVKNMGDSPNTFIDFWRLEIEAKKVKGGDWKKFWAIYYDEDGTKQTLQPLETKVFDMQNLNILRLADLHVREMGDLLSTPQQIFIRAVAFSITDQTYIYSDTITVSVEPLGKVDKTAFDSIQKMGFHPMTFAEYGGLWSGYRPEPYDNILQNHPESTFADLARISYALYWTGYWGQGRYNRQIHAQAKQYLSEIRHTEYEYIRYFAKEAEHQLTEAEKRGF
jgi:hypothetical protein